MEKREWSDLFAADLAVANPEIARLIAAQERQNRATVNLVASETYCPAATLAAEQHTVAALDVEWVQLAILIAHAGANSDDFAHSSEVFPICPL